MGTASKAAQSSYLSAVFFPSLYLFISQYGVIFVGQAQNHHVFTEC